MPRLTLPRVADESMPEAHDENNNAAPCSQKVVLFTFVEACPSSRVPRHLTCSESHNGNGEEPGCATRWKCQGPEVGNTGERHQDTKRDTKRDMRKLQRRTKQQIPAPNTTECRMGTPRQPNSTAAVFRASKSNPHIRVRIAPLPRNGDAYEHTPLRPRRPVVVFQNPRPRQPLPSQGSGSLSAARPLGWLRVSHVHNRQGGKANPCGKDKAGGFETETATTAKREADTTRYQKTHLWLS